MFPQVNLFKKKSTTVKPFQETTSLIINGPFRFTRNPMYIGMVAILLGEAMLFGSLLTFIGPIAFYLIISWIFIPFEEGSLEGTFGQEYLDYKKKVRRWL